MSHTNWNDILGWSSEHLQELRFTGYIFLKEGKYEIAKIYFEALTAIDPNDAYDRRTLGAIYLIMGDFYQALSMLETALLLEPSDLGAQLNHTKALLYLGKLPEGLQEARRLSVCNRPEIAQDAQALVLAYGQ